MVRELLKEVDQYKLYESDNGNLSYESPNRTVSIFQSGSWCVSCQSPETVSTGDRVVYGFMSGYPSRDAAMDQAKKYATKPLSEFDA